MFIVIWLQEMCLLEKRKLQKCQTLDWVDTCMKRKFTMANGTGNFPSNGCQQKLSLTRRSPRRAMCKITDLLIDNWKKRFFNTCKVHMNCNFNHYSFKIFRCFWLDPVPRQIFITNWRLLYLEDATDIPSIRWYISLETRFIDGIFAWKRGCMGNSELKKIAFMAIRRRNTCSWFYNSKLNGRNARIYPETMCF